MVQTSTPWLSILLPVYRVEAYLQACADSILPQADAGVELVFVDDASPDASYDLLAQLQQAHPGQVRVFTQSKNQGVSAARNRLLDEARGDYLWFIDPDDLLEPGAIPRLKALIEAEAPDLIMCDFRAFEDESGRVRKPRLAHVSTFAGQASSSGSTGHLCHDRDALIQGLFKAGQLHPWSKIIRRALWPAELRFPLGRIFEDLAVLPRLALQVNSYHHVPEVWVGYRQRPGSALANLSAARIDDWMQALLGYGAAMKASATPFHAQTEFEVAHFSARTLLRACKRRQALGGTDARNDQSRYVQQWSQSSPLTARQLLHAYLGRGMWLRALQLWLCLRRAAYSESNKSS
nr:glycosyltransferase family 2 protein [uncultured Roseateles sp.]